MMIKIKQYVTKSRQKSHRIKTIFNHLRKLEKYEGWSDIVLLNSIVYGLIELGEPYSKHEVRTAFKIINKGDYGDISKCALLKELLREASEKSVFK